MKKIHVLYILTKLELGGAQKVCLSLFEGIKNQGHFSSLLCGAEGVLAEQAQKQTSVFFLKSFKREVGIKNIVNEIKTFFLLIKRIRILKKRYPNIIVHTHSTKAGILGRWAAFFARVKTRMHTVHGFSFHDHQHKLIWFVRLTIEYMTSLITTHFVCVSQYDMNIGKKYFPRFAKKSSIIRAAVDWERFYITKKETRFYGATKLPWFTLGTVSCFKPQKNLFDLLRAFKRLQEQVVDAEVRLQIIGDGALRPDIERWILDHNLQSHIDLLGWQEDVASFLKHWDLFVLTSLWEGLPCAVVEARLSKVPVISYSVAGIPEVIFDGKNGFLFKTGQWQALADKISLLIKDYNLLHSMRNYNDDLSDFHNKNMVLRHLKLYKNLLQK